MEKEKMFTLRDIIKACKTAGATYDVKLSGRRKMLQNNQVGPNYGKEKQFTLQDIINACSNVGIDYDLCRLLVYELLDNKEN